MNIWRNPGFFVKMRERIVQVYPENLYEQRIFYKNVPSMRIFYKNSSGCLRCFSRKARPEPSRIVSLSEEILGFFFASVVLNSCCEVVRAR